MSRPHRRLAFVLAVAMAPAIGTAAGQDGAKPTETAVAEGPKDVAPDEIAGRVVDAKGRPVPGVRVELQYWVPGHKETTTDREGVFRFAKASREFWSHVRVRPEGYAWQEFMGRKAGEVSWTVVLRDDTRFEGKVLDPAGKPVAGAPIVADGGRMEFEGYVTGETLTEVRTDADGAYRLFVAPGSFEIAVRVPGSGVARLRESILAGQAKPLDLKLAPGVELLAQCLDHDTGKPVPGVKLAHWLKPGIEGTSDEKGLLTIPDVPPGRYPRFEVEAPGYARWWSPEAASPWARFEKRPNAFQRNFDGLDFDITPDFGPVTIELERAATVRGRVLDPDGKAVAGATVAPALSGTGNSLTGDTRFSVRTDAEGRFEARLPASRDREYNLIAHDGDFREWRTWANGVSGRMVTSPGQVIEGQALTLNRPAVIAGRVVDAAGKPVAGREVRAVPQALDENRYYDPTTKTDADGRYALKFVRPGANLVQVFPFWLRATDAPAGTTRAVVAKAGETIEGIDLVAQPNR